ncbi:MAG: 16S rRNA (adenine(1518)-N(6)/adenine(1519)-N(6))-dimethyltransferase RsmA [Candidatus Binatia bacterium]
MPSLYQETRAFLRESDFKPRKRLGQHFLVHENVIGATLRLLELSADDEVMEIGPGLGFLTRRLVDVAHNVWAVEVDTGLATWLERSDLRTRSNFHLIRGDILTVDLSKILPDRKVKLVGNLPYSISTPVLFRLFDERDRFSLLVLMVQREVAERMSASPGTKAYGSLSVWCQIHGQISDKVSVSPEAFFPRPKVRSTILKIGLRPQPLASKEELPVLHGLVRAAFGQRRKTLSNALGSWLKRDRSKIDALLREEGIDPKRRGETLSVEEFIRLAHALSVIASAGS